MSLDLSECWKITDEGVISLVLKCPRLSQLELIGTEVRFAWKQSWSDWDDEDNIAFLRKSVILSVTNDSAEAASPEAAGAAASGAPADPYDALRLRF
jgi:hypothetical protein